MEHRRERIWSARDFVPNRNDLAMVIRIALLVSFAAYAADFMFGFDLFEFVRENKDFLYGKWLLKPFFKI
jgi:hypothetical protein